MVIDAPNLCQIYLITKLNIEIPKIFFIILSCTVFQAFKPYISLGFSPISLSLSNSVPLCRLLSSSPCFPPSLSLSLALSLPSSSVSSSLSFLFLSRSLSLELYLSLFGPLLKFSTRSLKRQTKVWFGRFVISTPKMFFLNFHAILHMRISWSRFTKVNVTK